MWFIKPLFICLNMGFHQIAAKLQSRLERVHVSEVVREITGVKKVVKNSGEAKVYGVEVLC